MIPVIQEIPLSSLVASSANVRRTAANAGVEELAASIRSHGLLQNLTVRRAKGKNRKALRYEVIAGGRRLSALKMLAAQEMLANDVPIPCQVIENGIAEEVSLAENALQCPMHPADQYEAFAKLHAEHGMSAEDIAARFGVTPTVVRQRLKLGSVSPRLIALYRDEEMTLEQLTAFAICDDHTAQERAWDSLPEWQRSRDAILAALNEGQVATDDRRVTFVTLDAYEAAGGGVTRDLFDAEGGGYLTDPALLDRLVKEKLEDAAAVIRVEGWKWVQIAPEFDHQATADFRRVYPEPKPLHDAQQERLDAINLRLEELAEIDDEGEEDVSAEIEALEAEAEAISGPEHYRPEDIAIGGVVIGIGYNGELRIERGLIRKEDAPKSKRDPKHSGQTGEGDRDDPARGLSQTLVTELTSYRTAGLADALAAHPDMALRAVVHAFTAQTFYGFSASCLDLTANETRLHPHTAAIAASPAGAAMAERHGAWEKRMPADVDGLWPFIGTLDLSEQLALLAHCAAQTVDAVRRTPRGDAARLAHADQLAAALGLDMTRTWSATAEGYFAKVSKEQILAAVREGVSPSAAENLASLKKGAMAEAAAEQLSLTPWLPALLRTPAL